MWCTNITRSVEASIIRIQTVYSIFWKNVHNMYDATDRITMHFCIKSSDVFHSKQNKKILSLLKALLIYFRYCWSYEQKIEIRTGMKHSVSLSGLRPWFRIPNICFNVLYHFLKIATLMLKYPVYTFQVDAPEVDEVDEVDAKYWGLVKFLYFFSVFS